MSEEGVSSDPSPMGGSPLSLSPSEPSVIREGFLYKRSKLSRSWKQRYFVLRSTPTKRLECLAGPDQPVKHVLRLDSTARVKQLEVSKYKRPALKVTGGGRGGETFVLSAEEDVLRLWAADIMLAALDGPGLGMMSSSKRGSLPAGVRDTSAPPQLHSSEKKDFSVPAKADSEDSMGSPDAKAVKVSNRISLRRSMMLLRGHTVPAHATEDSELKTIPSGGDEHDAKEGNTDQIKSESAVPFPISRQTTRTMTGSEDSAEATKMHFFLPEKLHRPWDSLNKTAPFALIRRPRSWVVDDSCTESGMDLLGYESGLRVLKPRSGSRVFVSTVIPVPIEEVSRVLCSPALRRLWDLTCTGARVVEKMEKAEAWAISSRSPWGTMNELLVARVLEYTHRGQMISEGSVPVNGVKIERAWIVAPWHAAPGLSIVEMVSSVTWTPRSIFSNWRDISQVLMEKIDFVKSDSEATWRMEASILKGLSEFLSRKERIRELDYKADESAETEAESGVDDSEKRTRGISIADSVMTVPDFKECKIATHEKPVHLEFDLSYEFGFPDYVRGPEGGLHYTNMEEVTKQRWVAKDLLRQFGSNLLKGKSLTAVSMPVKIFEPRSFLQRLTDTWCYAPTFLTKAASAPNEVERFKLCVAFAFAGLHRSLAQLKPFNPILGETYQGFYSDGTSIAVEQVSHHPPVSAYTMNSEKWKMYGAQEYNPSISVNSATGAQKGVNTIEFSDGGKVCWEMPPVMIKGLSWGDRIVHWVDKMQFEDKEHGLKCEITFAGNSKSSGWLISSKSETESLDKITGTIYRPSSSDKKAVCTLSGSWLEELCFDDIPYWSLRKDRGFKVIPVKDPLPSDSRFREDLIKLAEGDVDAAQTWKTELEERQRRDRKLRNEKSVSSRKSTMH